MVLPLRVEPRSALRTSRRLVVRIGAAPDGIPLLMSIDRGNPPEMLLTNVARRLGAPEDSRQWTGPLRATADDLVKLSDGRQFFESESPDGKMTTYYLCESDLRSMLGPTLLQRLAADAPKHGGPPIAPSLGSGRGTRVNYGTVSQIIDQGESDDTDGAAEEFVRKHEEMSSSKFALDVDSEAIAIARAPKIPSGKPMLERVFLEESFAYFDSARFKMFYDDKTIVEGRLGKEYLEARANQQGSGAKWIVELKMRDILRMAIDLAKEIADMHALGIVHGDLKPANVLVGRNGPKPIDSLNVPVGELSPGLTRGYAAPEQVLGEPVGAGTDQYAFAVMVADLIGGTLHGEEATFTVPVGGKRIERFTVLKSPSIYLDSEATRLPREAIRAVKSVLERCLRFKPDERFAKIQDVAEAFAQLVESHGLFANLSAPMRFGDIARFPDNTMGWLLHDRQPSV